MKKWILLIIFLITLCGCKTQYQTITEYREVYVHDTTEVEVERVIERKIIQHDTTRQENTTVIHDSVIYYLDAEGNVVNKEHFRNEVNDRNKETIHSLERELDSIQNVLQRQALWYESQLNHQENERIEVSHWYDPIAPYCIGACLLLIIGFILWMIHKLR